MGRMYTITMDAIAISAAKDLIRLSAPATGIVVIHEVTVSQEASETSDMVAVQLMRASTDGSGTAGVEVEHDGGDAAFGGTSLTNLTSDTTPGVILWRKADNLLNGFHYLPTPEMRPIIPPSGRFVVRLEDAPGVSVTLSATVTFEEIGG